VLTFGILLPKFPRGNSCYPSLSGIDSEYVAFSSFDKLPCLGIGQKQEKELKRFFIKYWALLFTVPGVLFWVLSHF